MKLVPFKQAAAELTNFGRKAGKASAVEHLRMTTFKRDRLIAVDVRGGMIHVHAEGYQSTDVDFPVGAQGWTQYKHTVKQLLKREFPRSTHAYFEHRIEK